jgi:hypothetical protein
MSQRHIEFDLLEDIVLKVVALKSDCHFQSGERGAGLVQNFVVFKYEGNPVTNKKNMTNIKI